MFVQTEITPNPNSLKFLPGKTVSNDAPIEITDKTKTNNELVRNILSINGVTGIFFVIVVLPAPDGEESTILKPKTNSFVIY